MACGVREAGAEADICPVADGGEGTLEAVLLGDDDWIDRSRSPVDPSEDSFEHLLYVGSIGRGLWEVFDAPE